MKHLMIATNLAALLLVVEVIARRSPSSPDGQRRKTLIPQP